jgi:hypothetical protein
VTITPEQSFIDWYRIILQPSEEDMKDYIAKGQARTWFHAPRIQQMLKVNFFELFTFFFKKIIFFVNIYTIFLDRTNS